MKKIENIIMALSAVAIILFIAEISVLKAEISNLKEKITLSKNGKNNCETRYKSLRYDYNALIRGSN